MRPVAPLLVASPPAPYRLVIELPALPHLQSGTWGHWARRRKHDKQWREWVGLTARAMGLPPAPLARAHVKVVRFSSVQPDADNQVAAAKPLIDGLIGLVIVDDSPMHITREYDWFRAPPRQGKTVVVVEERQA